MKSLHSSLRVFLSGESGGSAQSGLFVGWTVPYYVPVTRDSYEVYVKLHRHLVNRFAKDGYSFGVWG